MEQPHKKLYNLYIQVKVLQKQAPLLFTWWSSERLRVEGCLVTCSCQGLSLEKKGDNISNNQESNEIAENKVRGGWEKSISEAIKKAEIVSLYGDLSIGSVISENLGKNRQKRHATEAQDLQSSVNPAQQVLLGQVPLFILPTNIHQITGAKGLPSDDSSEAQVYIPNTIPLQVPMVKSNSESCITEEKIVEEESPARSEFFETEIPGIESEGSEKEVVDAEHGNSKIVVEIETHPKKSPEDESRIQATSKEAGNKSDEAIDAEVDRDSTDDYCPSQEHSFKKDESRRKLARNKRTSLKNGIEKVRTNKSSKSRRRRKNCAGKKDLVGVIESLVNDSSSLVDISDNKLKVKVEKKRGRKRSSDHSESRVHTSRNRKTKPHKVKPIPPYQPYFPPVTDKPIVVMGIQDLAEYKDLVKEGKIKDEDRVEQDDENKWADLPDDADNDDIEIQEPGEEEESDEGEPVKAIEDAYNVFPEDSKQQTNTNKMPAVTAPKTEMSAVSDALAETAKVLQNGNRESCSATNFEEELRDIAASMDMSSEVTSETTEELERLVLEAAARASAEREDGAQQTENYPVYSVPYSLNNLIISQETRVENVIEGAFKSATNTDQVKTKYDAKLEEYKTFKDKEFLDKYHKNQIVDGGFFILCEFCAKPTSNKSYKKHVECCHSQGERERDFMCSACGKRFLNEQGLEKHKLTHTNIRFKCSYCDKTYKQDYNRKAHEKTHNGKPKHKPPGISTRYPPNQKYIQCEVCGKVVRATSMRAHMNVHDNKRFTCEVCGKSLKVACKYQHMQTHKDVKKHTCLQCSRKFSSKGSLQVHMRIHTKEKPLQCRYCSETFARNQARINHERRHTGEKPYRCDYCNKTWRDHTTAWCHMRRHHPGKKITNLKKLSSESQQTLEISVLEAAAVGKNVEVSHTVEGFTLGVDVSSQLHDTQQLEVKGSNTTKESVIQMDVALQHQQDSSVHQQDAPTELQQDAPLQHQQDTDMQLQQDASLQHQQDTSIQHQQEGAIQHQQDASIQHQQDTSIQHQQDASIQHQQDTHIQTNNMQQQDAAMQQDSGLQRQQNANLQQDSQLQENNLQHHQQPASQQQHHQQQPPSQQQSSHLQHQSQENHIQHHRETHVHHHHHNGQMQHQPQDAQLQQHQSLVLLHQHDSQLSHHESPVSHSQDAQLVTTTVQQHLRRQLLSSTGHHQIDVQNLQHQIQQHVSIPGVVHHQQIDGHLNNTPYPLPVPMALQQQHPQIDIRQLPLPLQHENQFIQVPITTPFHMYHPYQSQ